MAEETGTTAAATTTEEKTGKVIKASNPIRAEFPGYKKYKQQNGIPDTPDNSGGQPDSAEKIAADKLAADNLAADKAKTTQGSTGNDSPKDAPTIDEAAFKAYLKSQGIEVGSIDELKTKVNRKEPVELTDEQKAEAAKKKEERLFDLHKKRGGTIEQWANFKKQSEGDPIEMGKFKILTELKEAGFTPEQAEEISKKMHFDVSDEELADMTPEEQAFIKKQREFGHKKFERRGLLFKNSSLGYLSSLEKQAESEDTDTVAKEKHSSNVEDALSKYQRKQSIVLGKDSERDLPSVEMEIPETALAEVKELIGNRDELQKKLTNADGSYNLDFLIGHLVKSIAFDKAAKVGFLSGEDVTTQTFKKTFGEKAPPDLKANGRNTSTTGSNGFVSASTPKKGNFLQKK